MLNCCCQTRMKQRLLRVSVLFDAPNETGRHCMLGSGDVEFLLSNSYEAAVASRIGFV